MAKPFVKWVGGKRSILPQLIDRMPAAYGDYWEPFVGGGALFYAVGPGHAHLSDINMRLVTTYAAVRDTPDDVIRYLRAFEQMHDAAFYNDARRRLSLETEAAAVAALMIYLNKTCFNGLYRVNRRGDFNVPIGKPSAGTPLICDEENIRAASLALAGADVSQRQYFQIKPSAGDFVYLDPPYHGTFAQYSADGFGDNAQTELRDFCSMLDTSGVKFMLSNTDDGFIRDLYAGFNIETVTARRSVSRNGDGRSNVGEALIRNYG